MTVFPFAKATAIDGGGPDGGTGVPGFSNAIQYVFHTTSGAAYGKVVDSEDIICTFASQRRFLLGRPRGEGGRRLRDRRPEQHGDATREHRRQAEGLRGPPRRPIPLQPHGLPRRRRHGRERRRKSDVQRGWPSLRRGLGRRWIVHPGPSHRGLRGPPRQPHRNDGGATDDFWLPPTRWRWSSPSTNRSSQREARSSPFGAQPSWRREGGHHEKHDQSSPSRFGRFGHGAPLRLRQQHYLPRGRRGRQGQGRRPKGQHEARRHRGRHRGRHRHGHGAHRRRLQVPLGSGPRNHPDSPHGKGRHQHRAQPRVRWDGRCSVGGSQHGEGQVQLPHRPDDVGHHRD